MHCCTNWIWQSNKVNLTKKQKEREKQGKERKEKQWAENDDNEQSVVLESLVVSRVQ